MRYFAMILLMVGAIAQQSDSKSLGWSESQKGMCYEELTACIKAFQARGDDSTMQVAEILGVALDCGFGSLALEIREAEPNLLMRKHLDMQLLNHALAKGQLDHAAELADSIPDPDEGRATVAECYAIRGELRRSAEIVRQIISPRTSGAEWFRIAALASGTDRSLSDLAIEQGEASLKELGPLVETQGTATLALYAFAQIKRSPNERPLQVVNRLCEGRSDDLREDVYEELLRLFATYAQSAHFEQLVDELLTQESDLKPVSSSTYSLLNGTVRRRLNGLGASLVRAGSDVEKTLPAILVQFQLDRNLIDRMSDPELTQDLAAVKLAADADKEFSDKIYFGAIVEFTKQGKFTSAFELVRHLHKPEDAYIRIASSASLNGESAVAVEAVRRWGSSCSEFNENVFEYSAYQELIPVLVKLEEKPILDSMIAASQSSEQILNDAQAASGKGGLHMVQASKKLAAVISMAEAFTGLDKRDAAEKLIMAVSARLKLVQLGTMQANLASRLAGTAVASLDFPSVNAMLKADAPTTVRRALIEKICYEYGREEKKFSADAFIATVATPDEAVFGRLSFVKGLLYGIACPE